VTVRRIQRKTTSSWRIDFAYTCPISGARLRHRSTPETLAEATLLRPLARDPLPAPAASTGDKYASTCRNHLGSMLAQADQHPSRIQKLMGHVDMKTTQQYLHVPDSALVEAIHALTPTQKAEPDSTKTMESDLSA